MAGTFRICETPERALILILDNDSGTYRPSDPYPKHVRDMDRESTQSPLEYAWLFYDECGCIMFRSLRLSLFSTLLLLPGGRWLAESRACASLSQVRAGACAHHES